MVAEVAHSKFIKKTKKFNQNQISVLVAASVHNQALML